MLFRNQAGSRNRGALRRRFVCFHLLPKIPNAVGECAKQVHSCAHAHYLVCVGRYVHVKLE